MTPMAATEGNTLAAALEYAERGWHVLPCKPRGKDPLTELVPHAVLDSTTDPEVIGHWFQVCPSANLAVRCGSVSGLVVLDVDPRHGGTESLSRLIAENGALPDTVTCQTGGGGVHFYFRHPGTPLETWKDSGLELRIENVYVVAPPSVHPSGLDYRWSLDPASNTLAELPEYLKRPKRERPRMGLVVPTRTPEEAWASAALEAEIARLASCPAGNRNNLLNECAFNLGQIVASGFLSRVVVENRLLDAAASNGSLADDGESKTRGTIRSGLEAGAKEPRYPKDYRPPAQRTRVEVAAPNDAAPAGTAEIREVEYVDLATEPPPVNWMIRDWLAVHDIGVVSASAGAGKSTLVADLAVAISHGRPWCGSLDPLVRGPVLYFDEEQSRGTVQRMFRALGAQPGRGLHVASCQGIVLSTAEGRLRLEREINRHEPRLVVLDTVAQVFAGVDLASLEEVSEVFRFLFRLRDSYPVTFKLPTHNRKANRDQRGTIDALEQVFGSIGFGGGPDTVWNARRNGNALEVSQSKRRDNERGFQAMRVGYARDESGRISLTYEGALAVADTELSGAELLVVDFLARHGACKRSEIVLFLSNQKVKKATSDRAIEQLKKIGRIESPKYGFWCLKEQSTVADSFV